MPACCPSYDLILTDDEELTVGDLRIRTLATPGHTPGSICFAVEGTPLLFTGDTLFPGGPGNTGFEGGDFDSIITSIDRRIFADIRPRDRRSLPVTGRPPRWGTSAPTCRNGWIVVVAGGAGPANAPDPPKNRCPQYLTKTIDF